MFTSLVAATALLSLTSASPIAVRDTTPAAAATTYQAPYGTGSFQLLALSTGGNSSLGGYWLTGFHTGAGESVPVATSNQTNALAMHFNATTGDVYYLGGSPSEPYSIAFTNSTPYMSNAPAGYELVTQNMGQPGSRISFNPANHNTAQIPSKYHTFALCRVNGTSPYFSVGPEVQLFTRPAHVKQEKCGQCSDVLLQAVFNHNN